MAAEQHLRVDLQMDDRSLRGTATDDEGIVTPFTGWLGLLATVEAAQRRASPPPGVPEPDDAARATRPGVPC